MSGFELPDTIRKASFRKPPKGGFFIDTSYCNVGYVVAGYYGEGRSDNRFKFLVSHGDQSYAYDLPKQIAAFPINMGSGDYLFQIMERVEGTTYARVISSPKKVSLRSEAVPYVLPTVMCWYAIPGPCTSMAKKLCANCKTDADALDAVCKWVAANVSYDYQKAKMLSSTKGYVPYPDVTMSVRKGICFDYASLTAAMLRSVGIPCKVVTGYIDGGYYHAWVSAHIDGRWVLRDPTLMAAGKSSERHKVKFVY